VTREERISTVFENLTIFQSFVESEDYSFMKANQSSDPVIDEFLCDIMLRYDTIKFFQDMDVAHERTVFESQHLAQIVCDFMGYE
jgi:hypothetical protein